MSMLVDFGCDEMTEPDYDADYEEEDALIAEVTHTCCGRVQAYWTCSEADVPNAEVICRDCLPHVEKAEAEFDLILAEAVGANLWLIDADGTITRAAA